MDQYMSTYRKDFMWPYVRTFPLRTLEPKSQPSRPQSRCTCGAEPGGSMPPKEYVGPLNGMNYEWSRLGPMAPLLDPKLYPSKMGPAPEFEIMRYDQPNTYMRKLQEKYPYLYNVLQNAAPDELIRRVNENRLRTTYQVDYDHIDEHPSSDYERMFAQAGISSCLKVPSSSEAPPMLDCRAHIRPPDNSDHIKPDSDRFEHRAVKDPGGYGDGPGGFGNGAGEFRNYDAGEFGDSAGRCRFGAEGFRNRGGFENGARDAGGFENDARNAGGFGNGAREAGGFENGARENGERVAGGAGEAERRGEHSRRDNGSMDNRESGTMASRNSGDGGGFDSSEGDRRKSKNSKIVEDLDVGIKPLPPWRSEYQEVIGQTGADIIRDKIHQHGGRSKGRSFLERIIMKCPA